MHDAAIFDMDGLMFDTERLYMRALLEYVGPKTGVDFPMEGILRTLGCNHADFVRLFPELFGTKITPAYCTELVAEWMQREIETHGMPVKPGLYALLDALKADGYRIALATGTSRPIATIYLERTDTLRYFDAMITGDQVTYGKPNPEIFLLAAKSLKTAPQNCVVFEDSYNGLCAAHAGGFHTICVPDLVDPTPQLSFAPDAVLKTLNEAIPLLCRAH
jgi:HAD superfamily hydrolase (TIGR01509 family)